MSVVANYFYFWTTKLNTNASQKILFCIIVN